MAMTLRLTDEEADSLRDQAEIEGRSMQTVARAAIRLYVERHSHRRVVEASAEANAERFADALRRLGE